MPERHPRQRRHQRPATSEYKLARLAVISSVLVALGSVLSAAAAPWLEHSFTTREAENERIRGAYSRWLSASDAATQALNDLYLATAASDEEFAATLAEYDSKLAELSGASSSVQLEGSKVAVEMVLQNRSAVTVQRRMLIDWRDAALSGRLSEQRQERQKCLDQVFATITDERWIFRNAARGQLQTPEDAKRLEQVVEGLVIPSFEQGPNVADLLRSRRVADNDVVNCELY